MTLATRVLHLQQALHNRLRARADRRSPRPHHILLGERGEDAAFFFLRAEGFLVIARRWRHDHVRGDLDLVAWHGDTLVCVEVKTRRSRAFGPAEAAVDSDKQTQLRKLFRAFLHQDRALEAAQPPLRMDVLSVYLDAADPAFERFPGAVPPPAYRD